MPTLLRRKWERAAAVGTNLDLPFEQVESIANHCLQFLSQSQGWNKAYDKTKRHEFELQEEARLVPQNVLDVRDE